MARDVGAWLERLDLGRYAEAFADNGVDLRALPHLTEDDLKELGVLLGHRRVLLAAIAALPDPADAPPVPPEAPQGEAEHRQLPPSTDMH